ncbi:hypothetical protein E3E12_08105 [Formicincola oecophyllae]|uniref:Uncharacterized protein n=1 Tax=Formicincola oecophyllae TaxID=2558361 RepID=A0A4Y6UC63_9PROT|nr:hypothetical protein [Formicincola oecophyllae]QDH14158.1 hypothetical protein E3E12_08105 [Formicincola oecophyllae]
MANFLNQLGRDTLKTAYEACPILLTGGVAERMGGIVPIILYTEAVGLLNGLVAGALVDDVRMPDFDNLWCTWMPVSGSSTLISYTLPTDSYDPSSVSADGSSSLYGISNLLKVSMLMICPARGPGSMLTKLATLQALQSILYRHCYLGGMFTVITPGQIYTDMVLQTVTDATPATAPNSPGPNSMYKFEFVQPSRPSTLKKSDKTGSLVKATQYEMLNDGTWGFSAGPEIFDGLNWLNLLN